MKKALLLLCGLLMPLISWAYDFSAPNEDGVTIYYNILSEEDKTVEITKGTYRVRTISIPETVENEGVAYSVVKIGSEAFRGTSITSIVVPGWIKTIARSAFFNSKLSSLTLSEGIEELEAGFIYQCYALKEITIPASVTTFGDGGGVLFGEQQNLFATDETMSEQGLERIIVAEGNPVYDSRDNCNAVIETATNRLVGACKNTVIPNTVTTVGEYAFCGIYALMEINVPESVTTIEKFAFDGCRMTSLTLPANVTLGEGVFRSIGVNQSAPITICFSANDPSNIVDKGSWGLNELISWLKEQGTDYLEESLIYIPSGTYELYAADERFADIKDYLIEANWYDLTVTNAGLATLYLDFPVDVPRTDNVMGAFYGKAIQGNVLLLGRLSTIPEECGVIVMANPGTYRFFESWEDYSYKNSIFTGVLEDTPVETVKAKKGFRTILTLGQGKTGSYIGFYKFTGTTLGANKAFIGLETEGSDEVKLQFEDGTETSIENLNMNDNADKGVYDLSGRRVSQPTRGLYIVNGKKVLY